MRCATSHLYSALTMDLVLINIGFLHRCYSAIASDSLHIEILRWDILILFGSVGGFAQGLYHIGVDTRFSNPEACCQCLFQLKWPDGFGVLPEIRA